MDRDGPSYDDCGTISSELQSLERKNAIAALLYVLENEGCRRIDLYNSLLYSTSIQARVEELSEAGLMVIRKEMGSRADFLYLTDAGRSLARALSDFNQRMGEDGT